MIFNSAGGPVAYAAVGDWLFIGSSTEILNGVSVLQLWGDKKNPSGVF
jgi:hypothetical protein